MKKKKKKLASKFTLAGHKRIAALTTYGVLHLEAKISALRCALVVAESRNHGMPEKKLENFLDELSKEFLQKKLEQIETENPHIAAELSELRGADDLPSEFFL